MFIFIEFEYVAQFLIFFQIRHITRAGVQDDRHPGGWAKPRLVYISGSQAFGGYCSVPSPEKKLGLFSRQKCVNMSTEKLKETYLNLSRLKI